MNEFTFLEEVMRQFIKSEKIWDVHFFLWFTKLLMEILKTLFFHLYPNTAETSFYGIIGAVQDHVREQLKIELNKNKTPDIAVAYQNVKPKTPN